MASTGGRIEANISLGSIFVHGLVWILVSIITFGIGLMFFPYSFAKLVINRCYIWNAEGQRARLQCDLDIFSQIGHILLWTLLTLVTFGLAFPFYLYRVWNFVLNNTKVVV